MIFLKRSIKRLLELRPGHSSRGVFFTRIAHQSGANSAASTVNAGKACYANFVSLRLLRPPCSLLLPHLPVTAMAIRVMATSMVTAISMGAMSKTIGTIVSIGTLHSAGVGGAVAGMATAKVPAGVGRKAATSGFAVRKAQPISRWGASASAGALFVIS